MRITITLIKFVRPASVRSSLSVERLDAVVAAIL